MSGWGDSSGIEQAVAEMLSSDQLVAESLGANAIFQVERAQGAALTSVAYTLISDIPAATHDGPSGRARALVQIDVWAQDKKDMARVAARVTNAMYRRGTFGGIDVTSAQKVGERSDFDADAKLRRRVLEYLVFHSEPVGSEEVALV